jgi:hypothetical protein
MVACASLTLAFESHQEEEHYHKGSVHKETFIYHGEYKGETCASVT